MATYYVATNGNNGNNGASGTPWATIDYAVASGRNLQPGDTVIVRAGTYNTTGVKPAASGSAGGGYITIKSEVRGGAKVVTTGTYGITVQNKHHVRIEGFDVKGAKTGINVGSCHHVEIINNISHDNDAQGIYSRESEFLWIEDNEIYNNSTNNQANNSISVHFMFNASGDTTTGGYRMVVRGNYCHDNGINTTSTDSGGIMIDSNPSDNYTPPEVYNYPRLVENNLCVGNGGPGIIILEALNTTIRCNTCYHNGHKPGAGGFTANLVNRSDNCVWVNNIAVADKSYNPDSPAIACVALAARRPQVYTGVEWYNNVTFNDVVGEASLFSTSGNNVNLPTAANGNKLGVNPKFVNAGNNNFLPDTGSPLIDAGTTAHSGNPGVDYNGTARVAPIDIGAFEHDTVTPPSGTMSDDSTVAVMATLRLAATDILADVELASPFTTRASRNASPSGYVADTNNTVQNNFGPVTKTTASITGGSMIVEFSMKPGG